MINLLIKDGMIPGNESSNVPKDQKITTTYFPSSCGSPSRVSARANSSRGGVWGGGGATNLPKTNAFLIFRKRSSPPQSVFHGNPTPAVIHHAQEKLPVWLRIGR